MQDDDSINFPAALVFELPGGVQAEALCLERDAAAMLADLVAQDLRQWLPDIEHLRLALAGAHFDFAQVLRPAFPVDTALAACAWPIEGEVIALGAHGQRMPVPALQPEANLHGSALRLIPCCLRVPAHAAQAFGQVLEVELIGRGEAGVRTADMLMRTLGVRLQHARYMTRHDLMALTCVQYEHANLGALWALLEAALLSPERVETALSARGLALRLQGGAVHAQTPEAWLAQQPATLAGAARAHALAGIVFELRQYAALLNAHQLPLAFDGAEFDPARGLLIQTLRAPGATTDPAQLHVHEAPALGTVVVSVLGGGASPAPVLAHGWLLGGSEVDLCHELAARFACASVPALRGPLQLAADGSLGGVAVP